MHAMYLTYKLLTLPIGTPAEDRHAYTLSPWQLKTSKSTRSHECVQHSPTQTFSVLA